MMRRQLIRLGFVSVLSFGELVALCESVAQAQAPIRRIGILTPGTAATAQPLFEAFQESLRERGYVDGRQVAFERRFGGDSPDGLSEAAAELVRSNVDVIVTSTDQAIAAVKRATRTIPIVMANSSDPVMTGFVLSLAKPGTNITGNSSMSTELSAKRLELLRDLVPRLSRVALLWNPDLRGAVLAYKETQDAARALRLQVYSVELRREVDLDRALSEVKADHVDALIIAGPNPLAYANRSSLVAFAEQNRLPCMYPTIDFAAAGGSRLLWAECYRAMEARGVIRG